MSIIRFLNRKIKVVKKFQEHEQGRLICSPPAVLWIEPTNDCNLRCRLCFQSIMTRQRGQMTLDLFKKIIDDVHSWHPTIKLFHSGEPLFHPQLFEMITYAKKAGCYTIINTNATLLDDKKSRKILTSGLDEIHFSFDGVTKETYESIRKGAIFEKTLENIFHFLKLKKERNQERPLTVMEIIRVENTENEIEEFHRKFQPLVNKTKVQPLMDWAGRMNIDSKFISSRKKEYTPCTSLWMSSAILWDGSVVFCCMDFEGKSAIGNVKDHNFLDIWNNNKMQQARKLVTDQNIQKLEPCNSCSVPWVDNANMAETWRIKVLRFFIKKLF